MFPGWEALQGWKDTSFLPLQTLIFLVSGKVRFLCAITEGPFVQTLQLISSWKPLQKAVEGAEAFPAGRRAALLPAPTACWALSSRVSFTETR